MIAVCWLVSWWAFLPGVVILGFASREWRKARREWREAAAEWGRARAKLREAEEILEQKLASLSEWR